MCSCCEKKSDLSLLGDVMKKYAPVPGSLITILQHAQEIYGYLPVDVMYYIAEQTGNSPAKVMGVATFYTQFRTNPLASTSLCSVRVPPAMSMALSGSRQPSVRHLASKTAAPPQTACSL